MVCTLNIELESIVETTYFLTLTDGIFEPGAYGASGKSQNPILSGQGCPSSTQSSNPSWAYSWQHRFGTQNYPPF